MRDLSDPSIPEFERPAAAEGLRLGLNQANDLGWKYNICNWLSTCIKKVKIIFFLFYQKSKIRFHKNGERMTRVFYSFNFSLLAIAKSFIPLLHPVA